MTFNDLLTATENVVLEHVVYKEHTLGYLFRVGTMVLMGVHAGSVLRGGYDWRNGSVPILAGDMRSLRTATKADFAAYRVESKGHLA